MRRFIQSQIGKGLSWILVQALIIPFLTFGTVARSVAQIETLPLWAVVEFQNLSSKGGPGYGKTASDAVSSELAKTNKYELIPGETVTRAETELGYTGTLRPDQLVRLGQNIRATTIVSGQLVDYRVIEVGAGKQADVILRVEIRDVASGLPINGAALKASSAIKGGDVSDETLINEAISAAAYEAVGQIVSRTLPRATVLNTTGNEALINRGSRSGFSKDQEVIVTRGRDQVATAVVAEVEPDAGIVRVVRSNRGIQPGDKVQVVFNVPTVKGFTKKGDPDFGPKRGRGRGIGGSNAGLISVLLLIGVAVFLLGGGRGGGQDLATDVTAEAMVLPDDTPAVKLSWRPDGFVKGNNQRFQWQVYRSDTFGTPVMIAGGYTTEAIDDARVRNFTWYDFQGAIGTTPNCDNTTPANPTQAANVPGVVPGTTYTYQLELIYSLSALDLPGAGTTGGGTTGTTATTGGNTGGLTTGGGTTGLTTGGGTTGRGGGLAEEEIPFSTGGSEFEEGEIYVQQNTGGGGDRCYFASTKVSAKGPATPVVRPSLRAPVNNAIVATAPVFVFTSVRGATSSAVFEYVLQLSDDPTFPKNRTIMPADGRVVENSGLPGAQLSTRPIADALTAFKGSQFVYWRIGARNVLDNPGPVPVGGERYIFSAPFRFTRPTDPPIPPQ